VHKEVADNQSNPTKVPTGVAEVALDNTVAVEVPDNTVEQVVVPDSTVEPVVVPDNRVAVAELRSTVAVVVRHNMVAVAVEDNKKIP